MTKKSTGIALVFIYVCITFFSTSALANTPISETGQHLIIQYKNAGVFQVQTQEQRTLVIERLNNANGVNLTKLRDMSGHTSVLQLPTKIPLIELEALSQQLTNDDSIEYAEPDYTKQAFAVPNDPYYATSQWHYQSPATYLGAMNLPSAWDITKGDANMVIAVIDTGFRPHPDLEGRRVAGYDFISDTTAANDGDGRDSDATDTGDSCGGDSSWHGTHVAGTIGALTNNNLGVAGVNWNSKIQHIRVLGKCGGTTSDIADAIRWAAGLTVTGITNNATPAKIINMSLGSQNACTITEQNAINEAVAAGVVVVVAAGNNNMDASLFAPASCNNVITVAAVGKNGQRASYSNYGSVIDVAAPGGSDGDLVWSTTNSGTTTAVTDNYEGYNGTSMAAPHVTGAVSLMLAVNPTMSPAQVESYLKGSTRAFPAGTVRDCSTSICGTGLVDAYDAVAAVSGNVFPSVNAGIDQRVNQGDFVLVSSTVTDSDGTIVSYQWTQISGTTVTISNATAQNMSFTAPSTTGTLVFNLVATDNGGGAGNDSISITLNSPPTSSAGNDFSATPSSTVSLNGNGSVDDLSVASYAWLQTAGTSVTLANANTVSPSFTAPTTLGTVMTFQLTVTDNEGASATDLVNVTIAGMPVVNAGNDIYAQPNQLVNLTATASVDGGSIASYEWTLSSGYPATLTNATTANASFTTPNGSTSHTFQIRVTDNNGQVATDTVIVNVVYPPSAFAGFDNGVNPGAQATLDGSQTYSPSSIVISSYEWLQTAGTAVSISDKNAINPTFTATNTSAEVLTFQLTVTDVNGMSDVDSVSFTVNSGPVVTMYADQYVATNTFLYIQASAISYTVNPLSASWIQKTGTTVTLTDQGMAAASLTSPSAPTTLLFELHTLDGTGVTTITETRVIVGGAPLANAGADQTANPNATITLTGASSSDSDGSISNYSWVQLSGSSVTLTNANTVSPTFVSPNVAGEMIFQLTVVDNAGYSATDTVTINVNAPPVANAGVDQVVAAGDSVSLSGDSSTAAIGSIVSYAWTQLSGTNITLTDASTSTPVFTAPASGNLIFQLTVTDSNGVIATDTISIIVSGDIFVNVGADQTVNPGDNVTLSGSASGSSGTITGYTWMQTAGTSIILNNANTTTSNFTAPLSTGTLSFQLTATDNFSINGTDNVDIFINNVPPTLNLINNVSADVGTNINFTISATDANGSTPTLELNGLPTGATFNTSSGDFSWQNIANSGNFTLTARAVDAQNSAVYTEQTFTIDIASAGNLQFSTATLSINENDSATTITVNRISGSAGIISADYATENGTATAGNDFDAVSGTLIFAAGITSQTFNINPINDTAVEASEDFTLSLSNATGYASILNTLSTITIIDDDVTIAGSLSLSATSYSVAENGGSQTITVNRTGGSDGAVTVNYATTDVSATAGSDYTSEAGTLTFGNGITSQSFTLSILDDLNYEGNETLSITLSNPTGNATLGTSNAALTIVEDDIAPATIPGTLSFSASEYSISENGASVLITVNRSIGSDGNVSVNYTTSDYVATAGLDYTTINGVLSFAEGDTTQTFTVAITDDATFEGDENFNITLSDITGGATLGLSNARVLIIDDEQAPAPQFGTLGLSEPSYTANEDGGSITIAVNRLNGSAGTLNVDYQITDGSATIDSDYSTAAISGTLIFADGITTQDFVIDIIDDPDYEGDETITINLSNASSNTSLDTSVATLTILDNEIEPISTNQAPSKPVLLSPSNGSTGINPSLVSFDWTEAADPEGDAITYLLEYCINEDFINCDATQTKASTHTAGLNIMELSIAGSGAGASLALLGLLGTGSRRQRYLQIAAMVALSLIISACGTNIPIINGDGTVSQQESNLQSNTTYYWKVTATDSENASTTSEVWLFTTR